MSKYLLIVIVLLGINAGAAAEDLIAQNKELRQKLEQAKRQAAELYEQGKALRREKNNTEKTVAVMQQVLKNIKTNTK